MPKGTEVIDLDTEEMLGDLAETDQCLMVARGGQGGRGNAAFKSSVNRAPRQSTPGQRGEARHLKLSLKFLCHQQYLNKVVSLYLQLSLKLLLCHQCLNKDLRFREEVDLQRFNLQKFSLHLQLNLKLLFYHQ